MSTPIHAVDDSEKLKQPAEEPTVQPSASPAFAEERDEIEDLIADYTEPDDAWKVTVYRLTDPSRSDSASRREFCATLPVTDDLRDQIRDMWGGGDYSLEFKQKGKIRKKGNVSIAAFPSIEPELDDTNVEDEPEITHASELESRFSRLEDALDILLKRTANPTPQESPPSATQTVRDAMELMREMKALNEELVPRASEKPASSGISEEDRAWVMLLKDRALRSRISEGLMSAISSGDGVEKMPWYAPYLGALAQQPALANRALNLIEKFIPGGSKTVDDAQIMKGGEGGDLQTFLIAKCEANEPVTLREPEVQAIAAHDPVAYKQLLQALSLSSIQQIKDFFSSISPDFARVLSLPHVDMWLKNLKAAAVGGSPAASAVLWSSNDEDDSLRDDPRKVVELLLADLAVNAPVAGSAELIREFVRLRPDQATQFSMLMYAPSDDVLKMLSQNIEGGAVLAQVPHAKRWIEALQKEMLEANVEE